MEFIYLLLVKPPASIIIDVMSDTDSCHYLKSIHFYQVSYQFEKQNKFLGEIQLIKQKFVF